MFSYFYYNGYMAKRKKKVVQIDEALQNTASHSYPKVKKTPAGYPPLLGVKGKTWYERAINYELKYGKPVLPIQDITENDTILEENDKLENEDGKL